MVYAFVPLHEDTRWSVIKALLCRVHFLYSSSLVCWRVLAESKLVEYWKMLMWNWKVQAKVLCVCLKIQFTLGCTTEITKYRHTLNSFGSQKPHDVSNSCIKLRKYFLLCYLGKTVEVSKQIISIVWKKLSMHIFILRYNSFNTCQLFCLEIYRLSRVMVISNYIRILFYTTYGGYIRLRMQENGSELFRWWKGSFSVFKCWKVREGHNSQHRR